MHSARERHYHLARGEKVKMPLQNLGRIFTSRIIKKPFTATGVQFSLRFTPCCKIMHRRLVYMRVSARRNWVVVSSRAEIFIPANAAQGFVRSLSHYLLPLCCCTLMLSERIILMNIMLCVRAHYIRKGQGLVLINLVNRLAVYWDRDVRARKAMLTLRYANSFELFACTAYDIAALKAYVN